MKKIFFIIAISLLSNQLAQCQALYTEVKAKVEVQEIENLLAITGTVENLKSEFKNIHYKLTVFKKNKQSSNKSNNAQAGEVTLEPIQKVNLSKTQVNFTSEDEIIILLIIYDDKNTIIGKDRIVFGGDDQTSINNVAPIVPEDGLEMVGIVSNDTKTRLGNDFYDYFYYAFSNLKIKSHKIVSVQEELTFGRTTKIIVKVNEDVIDEFISKPDEDFLKYMAEASANKIFKYFKDLERQSKFITQY